MKIERNFQVIEAPRGRPFGGGAGHHNGIATSRNYRDCVIFMGNPKISINCESPIIGGDSACPPPKTAPVLCDGVVVPSRELSLQRGCHSGGGGALISVAYLYPVIFSNVIVQDLTGPVTDTDCVLGYFFVCISSGN